MSNAGPSVPLPSLRVAPCVGARYGEVSSISAGVGLDSAHIWDAWRRCWHSTYEYSGIPDQQPPSGAGHVQIANVSLILIGPDDRQAAAGQGLVCMCRLPPVTAGSDGGNTVDRTLRSAWSHADDSRVFPFCHTTDNIQDAGSCWQPHLFEQVTYWRGDPAASEASVQEDCRLDAVQWLGASTALDRGDLIIRIERISWVAATGGMRLVGPGQVSGGDYYIDCLLMPADTTRRLTAPLRNLGDRPVPLS